MRAKSSGWGGKREGAGRPPNEEARTNRVVIMLGNADLRRIQKVARTRKVPVGTAAFLIVSKSVRASVS